VTALPPLTLARYRLEFIVEKPLHLPAYAGSTLRGAFGGALRSSVCSTGKSTCDMCPLTTACPYAVVFETRKAAGETAIQVPRPYVIEPPQWGERDYAPGEQLAFQLVLAGRAVGQLPLILHAFAHAFRQGIGRGDGKARLARVIHLGVQETVVLESATSTLVPHETAPPAAPEMANEVTLHFESPLRLQDNGRRATADEYTPRRLLMAIVRRIALMNEHHGSGPLELDFSALARLSEGIAGEKNLQWRDWSRYSSRQKQKMALGGVVGNWKLKGELSPFLPFLHLGQWLHVGKEATFGLGGYRLS
jgi:hypothetical protein